MSKEPNESKNLIPIYIIAYNNLTYIKNMISQCEKFTTNIWIIDNASTNPKLLEYYKTFKYSLIRLSSNIGPRKCLEALYSHFPNKFICTDPDLQFSDTLPQDFISQLNTISEKYKKYKVGLALDISKPNEYISKKYNGKEYPLEWESQFWKLRIPDPDYEIYEADIDTTFALYTKKYFRGNFFESIRVAGAFTCEHLPWYKHDKLNISSEELDWYRKGNIASTVFMNSETEML